VIVPPPSSQPRHRAPTALLAAALVAGLVAACAGPSASPTPRITPSPGPTSTPSSPPTAAPSAGLAAVRLALDWTPNTNHTGFFVAEAEGWYADAGVRLDVLPYTGTTPEAILAAHQAECGISFQDAMTFAVAAGAPIASVMAILQHTAQEIAVLGSSEVERPRDLDGKVYAGFGYPNEVPTLQAVIRADGGTGVFDTVILDTAAYETLYAHRADFVITFTAWEGIEAAQRGIALREFAFADYGFPDFYQVVLACDRGWLAREPALARAFVGATVRGFRLAVEEPGVAAEQLIAQNPGVFDANPELPRDSARFLADGGYLVDDLGRVGYQTLGQWQGYSSFLYEQGLLTGPDGAPLAAPPDYATLFTNDYLP
jgi:ABC-type nitrate/sulfonate/bicarbonate transport system substrate-binding protein